MERYFYLGGTLVLNVYAQLILKQRALTYASGEGQGKLRYLMAMFADIGVISGLVAVALAGVLWTLALEKTDLSLAYTFMALSFVLVPIAAFLLFREPLSLLQLFGLSLIVTGVTISAFAR